ncbi:MAG: 3-methyladenine DNA glycosylase [Verrucomicrobia bacterium]|nr:MAG: 3-methyladenine DNA glycosylase [Verrucomicrobiota bacterium]
MNCSKEDIKNTAPWVALKQLNSYNPPELDLSTKIVEPTFFNRPTLEAAELTLGMWLCREYPDGSISRHKITEVEAYDGPEDKACHAHKGLTPRTEIMFGPSGYWYVYLCYGVHWMLNIVTGPVDYPAAILIRGTEDLVGPGRLTKALQINKNFNKSPIEKPTKLWLEHNLTSSNYDFKIIQTPRIGIDYAGPIWSQKPYRFLLLNYSKNDYYVKES